MYASLRRLVAFIGLAGAVTLVADVTLVWTGAADDQFTNPANWQQSVVAPVEAKIVFDPSSLQDPAIVIPSDFAVVNEGFDAAAAAIKLGGNVTFNDPVTVDSDLVLSPGNSPGTMNFANGLTLASGGTLDFEVQSAGGNAGTGYDLVNISGGLLDITATPSSPYTIKVISLNAAGTYGNVTDFSSGTGYSWMLFRGNAAGGIAGFDANKFQLDLSTFTNNHSGGSFNLTQGVSGGNPAIFLNFTAVPEPSTYALMALGLGAALLARRRRR